MSWNSRMLGMNEPGGVLVVYWVERTFPPLARWAAANGAFFGRSMRRMHGKPHILFREGRWQFGWWVKS